MMLYILRHATAEEAASSGDDGARKLTERSKEKMRNAAAGLRAMGLKFNVILTSPLARAAETAEIVSAAYENNPPPQVLPALATGVAATDAVNALRAFSKHEDVMIVGHEPQLSAVGSILLTGASDVVHLEIEDRWMYRDRLAPPLRARRRPAALDANPPPIARDAQAVARSFPEHLHRHLHWFDPVLAARAFRKFVGHPDFSWRKFRHQSRRPDLVANMNRA